MRPEHNLDLHCLGFKMVSLLTVFPPCCSLCLFAYLEILYCQSYMEMFCSWLTADTYFMLVFFPPQLFHQGLVSFFAPYTSSSFRHIYRQRDYFIIQMSVLYPACFSEEYLIYSFIFFCQWLPAWHDSDNTTSFQMLECLYHPCFIIYTQWLQFAARYIRQSSFP